MKLVELIVVMVIMGMLAAWALASTPGMPDIKEITTDMPTPTPPKKLDENTVQLRQNGENVNIDLDTGEVISK